MATNGGLELESWLAEKNSRNDDSPLRCHRLLEYKHVFWIGNTAKIFNLTLAFPSARVVAYLDAVVFQCKITSFNFLSLNLKGSFRNPSFTSKVGSNLSGWGFPACFRGSGSPTSSSPRRRSSSAARKTTKQKWWCHLWQFSSVMDYKQE